MSTILNFARDTQGFNSFGVPISQDIYSAALLSNTEEHFTVPTNFKNWLALFTAVTGFEIWVCINGTASGPAGATFAATTSTQNPGSLLVHGGDVISVISIGFAADICVALYAIPPNP